MRLRCTARGGYAGRLVSLAEGEEREVPDEEAERLLRDFPGWFQMAGGAGEPEGGVGTPVEKAPLGPPASKPARGRTKAG